MLMICKYITCAMIRRRAIYEFLKKDRLINSHERDREPSPVPLTNNPQNARGIQTFEEFSTGYVDSFGNTIHGMNFGGIYVPKCSSLNR